jgi:hypothetical protein
MIGGCTFSGRYSDPLAAPTATLIHHIPGWALFTAILLADQILPVLHDHGKQEKNYIAYLLVHKSTSAKDQERVSAKV